MADRRKARIAKEVFDAMNPGGPVNPTRRGERIAYNIVRKQAIAGRGLKAISKVAKVAGPVGTAYALYDATKWSLQWHKDNPGATLKKYKETYNK